MSDFVKVLTSRHYSGQTLGWLLDGSSNLYQPTTNSNVIAHDCIEHLASKTITDEMEAEGVSFWVRCNRGPRSRSLEEGAFAHAVLNLWYDWCEHNSAETDEYVEGEWEDGRKIAEKLLAKAKKKEDYSFDDEFESQYVAAFASGYNRAEELYGPFGRSTAAKMFDMLCRSRVPVPHRENQVLIIGLDFTAKAVRMSVQDSLDFPP